MSFHVPEASRITRAAHPFMGSDSTYGHNGAFDLESPEPGWQLLLVCSDGTDADAVGELADWEHVSVHAQRGPKVRTPTWREMAFVKKLCWEAEDRVVQFHPRRSEYVNNHPHVQHLWRWKRGEFPSPPTSAV
jgi:hypothetical protein